jgi:uncharacterized membrane protein
MHRKPHAATSASISLISNSRTALYTGAILTLTTGIGFVLYFFIAHDYVYLQSEIFWVKMCMLALIGFATYALSALKISEYWGSALLLASWWLAFGAGLFLSNDMHLIAENPFASFFFTLALYAAATISLAALLQFMRSRVTPHAVYDVTSAQVSPHA